MYTDMNIPLIDMKRIDGTHKMAQMQSGISSYAGNNWSFSTAYIPCLCPIFFLTSSDKNCMNKDTRKVET